jgi:hypothetical protein
VSARFAGIMLEERGDCLVRVLAEIHSKAIHNPSTWTVVGMVYSFVLNSNVHMICGDSVAKARCLFISVCSLELVPKLYLIYCRLLRCVWDGVLFCGEL